MYHQQNNVSEKNISTKSWWVTLILLLFTPMGIYQFYLGNPKKGILFLLTWGGLWIGTFLDLIKLLKGELTDKDGALIVKK